MKNLNLVLILFLLFLGTSLKAQDSKVDSLKIILESLGEEVARVNTLNAIAGELYRVNPDEAIRYGSEARNLAELLNYPEGEALANKNIGLGFYMQGEFLEALKFWEPAYSTPHGRLEFLRRHRDG